MQAGGYFFPCLFVDGAMARQPVHALEGRGNNADAQMCLSGTVKAFLVPGMKVTLVDDLEMLRSEGFFQFALKAVAKTHVLHFSRRMGHPAFA